MRTRKKHQVVLQVEPLEDRTAPSSTPWLAQSFDTTPTGALPSGWSQWSSSGAPVYAVASQQAYSPSNSLACSSSSSTLSACTWYGTPQQADVQASAAVYLGSASPTQVLVRGANLGTATPSYYAITVTQGLTAQLVRVQNGVSTSLAQLSSTGTFTQQWVQATIQIQGSQILGQVYRLDTSQYLNTSGNWQTTSTWALQATDSVITAAGLVGFDRPAGAAGTTFLDNFLVSAPPQSAQPPALTIVPPAQGTLLSGLVVFQANVTDPLGIASVQFYLNGQLQATQAQAPYQWTWDSTTAANGLFSLMVVATDVDGNSASAFYTFRSLNTAVRPASSPWLAESFDTTPTGALPSGWSQWSSSGNAAYGVSNQLAYSPNNSLSSTSSSSTLSARAWFGTPESANVQAGAAVFLGNASPTQVLVRGANLGTATPSYYAIVLTQGLTAQLVRVQNGVATILTQLSSAGPVSQLWVRATIQVQGSQIMGQVYRLDTGQYLNGSGTWQSTSTWVLQTIDGALPGAGLVGFDQPSGAAGTAYVDDFRVQAPLSTPPPAVAIVPPTGATTLSGTVTFQANVSDAAGIARVQFYLNGQLQATQTQGPFKWTWTTNTAANGSYALVVIATDVLGNTGQGSYSFQTQNAATLSLPTIPQHLPNIRIAELAYNGTPVDAAMASLLQNDVDLVVSGNAAAQIASIAPHTPQLLYANLSSLYGSALTSWLDYADANGISREAAFYHVTSPTPFSGTSPSSQPVNWFWAVYQGSTTGSLVDMTAAATGNPATNVSFGRSGQSLYLGYPEKFMQINLSLLSAASPSWSDVLQYPTAVNAQGQPTAWATLPTNTDTTVSLTHSGQITFDPPANWVAASLGTSDRLYYVRFLSVGNGACPVAKTILGRDYVNANGGTSGVIPVFDYAADLNGDGYLNDAEYAQAVKIGDLARFAYESRAFYLNYGQMRFATNPSNPALQQWVIQYVEGLLQAQPLYSGAFVDNSSGTSPLLGASVQESLTTYTADYAALLNDLTRAIAPRWVLPNTTTGGAAGTTVAQNSGSYFEEFAIAPLATTYQQFEALAATVAQRATQSSPAPYAILDSSAQGGSPNDPNTQIATLAYYYLLANPKTTFLDPFGGSAPSTSWSNHWFGAITYNVGTPLANWFMLTQGSDPSNAALTYRVYERQYSNALVLYKPLSSGTGVTGTLASTTATLIQLGGTYETLNADGTLGKPVTQISLQNGQGAILIKV